MCECVLLIFPRFVLRVPVPMVLFYSRLHRQMFSNDCSFHSHFICVVCENENKIEEKKSFTKSHRKIELYHCVLCILYACVSVCLSVCHSVRPSGCPFIDLYFNDVWWWFSFFSLSASLNMSILGVLPGHSMWIYVCPGCCVSVTQKYIRLGFRQEMNLYAFILLFGCCFGFEL